jgi:hypothetical protein
MKNMIKAIALYLVGVGATLGLLYLDTPHQRDVILTSVLGSIPPVVMAAICAKLIRNRIVQYIVTVIVSTIIYAIALLLMAMGDPESLMWLPVAILVGVPYFFGPVIVCGIWSVSMLRLASVHNKSLDTDHGGVTD